MKKKLLAALVISMAMAAPQAKAEPSALEQALNDPNVEKFILPSDQSISADLPITSERLFELNDFDTPTGDNYYNIIGNGHSGFGDNSHGVYDLTNVQSISGFNTKASASNPNGDGGAFFLDDDSCLVVLSNNFDEDKEPLMTTISDNYASGKGGAIYANYNWGGGVYLANTNVINNVAGDKGGGLYLDWGVNKIVALPGTNVVIADNLAYINGSVVNNDIYLSSPRKPQNSGGIRGTLSLVTSSTVEDPSSSVPTGAGNIIVGDLRAEGSSDIIIGSSSHENSAIGLVDIGSMSLDNDAMFSTQKVSPDSKTNIYISDMYMYRDSIINTVNGYIDDNLHIVNILLDDSNNKFIVDASLMNGNTVIDHFGTIRGGTGKLAVNIIGSDTTSGSVRLSSGTTSTATFAESTTQYGGLKYTFTQDPNDKGIFYYTTTKDRSMTLQEALKDIDVSEYEMPDLTVADENLGQLYHFDPEPPHDFVPRTLTIKGNGGILITDGVAEREGISIPHQLTPPDDDLLVPHLTVKDMEAFTGFVRRASDTSFADGGAILAQDSVLNIDNVAFIANTATGTKDAGMDTFGMGGALYIDTKDGYEQVWDPEQGQYIDGDHFKSTINDSSFINNKAITYGDASSSYDGGGAVYAKGDLDITDTLFAQNSAISYVSGGTAEGGAIHFTNSSNGGIMNRDLNISGSMFMNNVAGDVLDGDQLVTTESNGGAIDISKADMHITNSSFINNVAQAAASNSSKAQGGAIHIDKMLPTPSYASSIANSTFAMNKAQVVRSTDNGDGTYTLAAPEGEDQSQAYGGAIAIMPSSSIDKMSLDVTGSEFYSNEAGYGGAIYNMGSQLNVANTSFSGNKSTYYHVDPDGDTKWNRDMNGGAIYNYGEVNLDGVTFNSNYAKQISYDDDYNPIISNVKNDIRNDRRVYFIGNASTLDGGINGSGYTYFNLGRDKYGNPDPEATNTEMTIGENTSITQTLIEVNSGTVNIANADNITARGEFTVGADGTLNVDKGQFIINNTYTREFNNNGTVNILHNSEGTHGVLDFIADDVTFTNNGVLTSGGILTRDIAGTGTLKLNDILDVQSDRVIAGTLDMNDDSVNMQSVIPDYNTLTVGNLKGEGRFGIDVDITNNGGVATASDQLLISGGTANDADLILRSVNITGTDLPISADPYENYITFLNTTGAGTLDGIATYLGNLDNDGIATITSDGRQYKFNINATNKGNLDVSVGAVQTTLAQFVQGDLTDPTVATYSFVNDVIVDEEIGTTARPGDTPNDLYINLNGNKLVALGDETGDPVYEGITVDSGYKLNVNGIAAVPANPDGIIKGFEKAFIVNGATDTKAAGILNINNTTFSENDKSIVNTAGTVNIADSTFSGNISSTEEGTIVNGSADNNSAVMNIDNVTFTNNFKTDDETGNLGKLDITNYGTVNFVGDGSTLDGGVFGYYNGTTNFALDDGKSMDIGNNTYISQKVINIANGTTVNAESAFSLTPYEKLTNNGNLNIAGGWLLPSDIEGGNKYINNGTMTLGSDDGVTVKDVELLHTQLINNGVITGATANNKLVNSSSTITNNVGAAINMNIANTPFAALGVDTEDLEAYQAGTLDPVNDAALIALISGSEIGEAIDAGTLDTATLGNSVFGNLINYGTINGNIGNKYGDIQNLVTEDEEGNVVVTGTIVGNVDNADGTLTNQGIITGNITNNRDGVVSNSTGAVINGNIGDIAGATTNGGEVYNDGTINGGVLTNTTSGFHIAKFYNNPNGVVNGIVKVLGEKSIASNNGEINTLAAASNQYVINEGTFVNNGTIKGGLDNSGQFGITANGSINSTGSDVDSVTNNANAILISAGNITTTSLVNDGTFQNGLDPAGSGDIYPNATITGDVTNNNSMVNYGIITGDVDNNNGTFTNGGVINGDVENENGGTFTNNNKINGYADNMDVGSTFINNGSGVIDASETTYQYIDNEGNYENYGTIIGGIDNDGNFYNAGSIDTTGTDGYIENGGLFVNAGNVTANVDNSALLYNGVNPADPEETMPTATITGDTNNYATIANGGNIVGDIFNDDSLGGATVYLYNGGTVTGDVTSIPDPTTGDNQGDLILAGGNGTVTGDVNVKRIGLIPISGTLGELNLQGDVNADAFVATGGTLNLQNNQAGTATLGEITLGADTNIKIDTDLNNNIADTVAGTFNTEASEEGAKINITGMNVIDNGKYTGQTELDLFADDESRDALKGHLSTPTNLRVYKPIFMYSGGYNSDTGKLRIKKEFNPAILVSPVATQLGGYLTQLNSYDEAFRNMDMYMLMTSKERQALKMRNKIASLQNAKYDDTKSLYEYNAGWFRPYATFENVPLHKGPRVSNVAYGTFFGGDSSLKDLGHGWDGMWGAYVGYNGSHQAYSGNSIYQNGGTIGLTGMAYKNNFFVGGTVNVGANAGEASTMFGHDDFAMLMTGAAVKAGYNWELAGGKFIIQPSLQTSYSFVNTFDYTNAAGVRMDSDPLHAIQVEPGIKFIGNLKNGWQPYAGVSFVYNIMDRAHFRANDVTLPNLSINPYVRYGIGVRKTWGERLTGHFQTYFTNGGRNGVGLSAGFRWAIGKEGGNNSISGKTTELKPTKISLNNIK